MNRPNLGRRHAALAQITGLAACALVALASPAALAQADPPKSLALEPRPEPPNLYEFVRDKQAAIVLGKALFWDMQVGSDGKTACASCHFHAGADPRSKHQLSPGLNRTPTSDNSFQVLRPNGQLRPDHFPFHGFEQPESRHSGVVREGNDVSSSQGVFNETFRGLITGKAEERRLVVNDPIYNVAGINLRRVEPRNTPSVINAVFNLRNFWDGRANYTFNGVNPFGRRDPSARVYKADAAGAVTAVQVSIQDASLASQASGPPLSDLEMSALGRSFPAIGRKLLRLTPLNGQAVAADDSQLASYRGAGGKGLNTSYAELIRSAFRNEWWSGSARVNLGGVAYTQMEANFSLYFGLALQLYQATLVSDQTPFDRYAEGQTSALTAQQIQGLGVFWGKGKCANCHGGAPLSNAAIGRNSPSIMADMLMASGSATYDEGFYNIGVRPTADDLGVGGVDPFGNPLSFSGVARLGSSKFASLESLSPNETLRSSSRIAVNGSFKSPALRNVELTAPYFHNGSVATLMQVVEFYNRGGNFKENNLGDLAPDIGSLNLDHDEKMALVSFLKALTDDRVRRHAAPFDHPELLVPNGHQGDQSTVISDGQGRAVQEWLRVPAVGARGYVAGQGPASFLGLVEFDALPNLALRKPTLQSSTYSDYTAALAVDGLLDGDLYNDSVSRTEISDQPWWQVDLGAVSQLSLIEIWNRTNSGREDRIGNFTVFVSDTDMSGLSFAALQANPAVAKFTYSGVPPTAQIQVLPPRATGRYVRIQLPEEDSILNIAEVIVRGRPAVN